MSQLIKSLALSNYTGSVNNIHWSLLKHLLILCIIICATDADFTDNQIEEQILSPPTAPFASLEIPDLPLPVRLPLFQKQHRRRLSPLAAPKLVLAPAQPPDYGPLITSTHPPSSSHLSRPSMRKSETVPPATGLTPPRLADIAPSQSGAGTLPTGLAQPPLSPHASNCCGPETVLKRDSEGCHCVYPIKLDILLLNVSSNPNWNLFLQQFATQLGLRVAQIELINFYLLSLSRLNISMDITPHTGVSFPSREASRINSSLSTHKVRLDPRLVGGYELLNLTWFKPVAPAHAPRIATSPTKAPPSTSSSPTSVNTSGRGKHLSLILVVGIGVGILSVAVICVLIICSCASRRHKPEASPKETAKPRTVEALPSGGSFPHPTSTRFLAYEELKEATNNFQHSSILGEGGFGRVFKGVLHDGTEVAIKRLSSGGQQGDKEFLVEVEMLSRLHHRNLVKLVGYYSNRDNSENLLCYELVPNGSLEAWLHGPLGVNCPLDWDTRMKIALDAARGLAYLHEDSQPCVIHRDFKASNILLENNFNAKVADFGLAKQAPEGRATYLSTRVMGTFGYVAPEYAMTGHLLVKSDVYSYGVVLLELLTGRKPVDMSQPSGQENLVSWARPILRDKDRLEELADPKLGGKYPIEDLARVCTIAAACVSPEASQRPTMGEVVQSLKMVQRVTEYQDSTATAAAATNARPSQKQSSTTFESDGTSSIFSSGPYSGLSAFDHDNISRTALFSEDLHEGR
ncbi:receptor-like serine/threonine-protein kinase ALE2 [Cynara cardunculus var. scolymus]|uniref:receptor-like serine/threonine-protein kinase ALE2 n=1 Tax=Cynara cardunculus var. scolymus TaxID=59895 RepID=UPI000D62EC55|nr:receptor-like serine/threonine-protein kinase ALE2 [Cynara cardunculus var. scolymus]